MKTLLLIAAILGVLGGIVFGMPVALLAVVPHLSACEDRCDDSAASLVALGAAYFAGVAAGAALPPARACTGGKRFARAVIGALAGGAVGIGAGTSANRHRGRAAA